MDALFSGNGRERPGRFVGPLPRALDFGAAELVAPAAGWAGSACVRRPRADDFREHRVAPDPASYLPGLRHGGTGEAARRGVVGRIGDVGRLASAEFGLINFTWTATHPWFLNVLTHGSLALEVGYPALVWVRPLRPLILGLTVALHLGIALVAPGLTEFGLAMIAGNLAFASGPWLRSLVTGVDPARPAGKVLYDGACPRCRASMAFLTAADPDRVLEPIDLTAIDLKSVHPSLTRDACMTAMHLVRADGRVLAGYDAIVTLVRWLPMLAMFGILARFPASHSSAVAFTPRSRPLARRDVPCTDDVCGIHAGPRGSKS